MRQIRTRANRTRVELELMQAVLDVRDARTVEELSAALARVRKVVGPMLDELENRLTCTSGQQ